MKLFKSLQQVHSGSSCQNCTHFQNDPGIVEKLFPGLYSLSSGYASVRDHDGLCMLHQLYLSARDSCLNFSTLSSEIIKKNQDQ